MKRPKPPGSQPGKVARTIPQRGAQSMDKVKFFNQQLNGQIVMAELEAEHLAEVLTALRKVARDSEVLMEREEKA